LAQELVDAALRLALFLLALAQPLVEIGDGRLGCKPVAVNAPAAARIRSSC
jgi:hypothetical protein